ncbi:hypothetical protein D9M71_736660 [compost metagenome]
MVHVHVGEDVGYGQRMGDVGFAAAAALPVMGLLGIEVGSAHQVDLVGAEISRKSFGKGVYARQGFTPCRPS